jgi:hypothetical protein
MAFGVGNTGVRPYGRWFDQPPVVAPLVGARVHGICGWADTGICPYGRRVWERHGVSSCGMAAAAAA